ncbi:MAG: PSD1 and planctomycete cytochrome C domain-containing protein [Pirellulales bacterium]
MVVPHPAAQAGRPIPRGKRRPLLYGLLYALLLNHLLLPRPTTADENQERFERAIRPLFIAHCARCHGATKQEAGLRVDARELLLRGGDSGPALVPGDPRRSLLLQVVRHEHEIKMPPDGKLRPDQIADLEQWVAAGAPWPAEKVVQLTRGGPITADERSYWAFVPPVRPAVPAVARPELAWSPLDRFLVREWERRKLDVAPLADRRTLLRRLAIDLTGLPPTPDQMADLLADEGVDAVARVVDRLLATPAYGERAGRLWLDAARYADTAGDGADYPVREAFRYRNYVVRALNADKPYGEFLREQLAGDILAREAASAGQISADQYADQVVATGYLAVSKRFGYNINTDFQHLDIADTIEGLGRSVLGLSIGCARCHDHKYDPINMADYYAWYGIFASSRFSFPGGEEHKRPHDLVPLVPPAEQARIDEQRRSELATFDAESQRLSAERAKLAARLPGGPPPAALLFEDQAEGQPLGKPWFQAGPHRVLGDAQSPLTHVAAAGQRGVRIEPGQPHDGIRYTWPAPFTTATAPRLYFSLDFRNHNPPTDAPGAYRFYLGQGAIASLAWEASVSSGELRLRDGDGWRTVATLVPARWYNLQLEIDTTARRYAGRVGRPGEWQEFRDLALAPGWQGTLDTFFCDGIGQLDGRRPTRDLDNLFLQTAPLPDATRPGETLTAEQLTELRQQLTQLDAAATALQQRRTAVAAQPLYAWAYAVTEGQPRDVAIQKRGEPDRPGEVAPRRNLEIFGGAALPSPAVESGRRALADWLTRPDQPLTWRVMVNRIWQQLFGRGIVPTASDFGTRGEPPSHPELLDFLARELLRYEGSLKAVRRDVVLSRTYQLASIDQAASAAVDPTNRWLWKHTRRPLDAEALRDGLLDISGDLDRSIPGPHPFPPTESWGFTIHYPFSADYDSSHRSLYLMVQRARKHPYLSLFDGADPNLSTAERLTTTTPIQALYLLNAPGVHGHAVSLARRLQREQPDDRTRVVWAFAAITGRETTDEQLAAALDFVARYRAQASATPATAATADEAAWAALARSLFTSNAYLFVD